MGFSRPEPWSRQPFPSPGDRPNPGLNPGLLRGRRILYQPSYREACPVTPWWVEMLIYVSFFKAPKSHFERAWLPSTHPRNSGLLVNVWQSPLSRQRRWSVTFANYWGALGKDPPATAGDTGLMPGSGRCPGGGHGNPLQYSCLETPRDRGAWQLQSVGSQRVRPAWATSISTSAESSDRRLPVWHLSAERGRAWGGERGGNAGGLAEAALTLRWSTVAFLWTSPPPVVRNLERLHLRMSFTFAAKVSKGLSVGSKWDFCFWLC